MNTNLTFFLIAIYSINTNKANFIHANITLMGHKVSEKGRDK